MRIDKSYVCMDGPQDWIGYDFLKADLYTDAKEPMELYVEVRDQQTTDYWTRVNYTTVAPRARARSSSRSSSSTWARSRGPADARLNAITRLVFSIPTSARALFVDNVRLERDDSPQKAVFDGLWPSTSARAPAP